MNFKPFSSLIVWALSACLFSCEMIVDADAVNYEGGVEQLVAIGFISPEEDSIIINISESIPMLRTRSLDEINRPRPITDADARLIDVASGEQIRLEFLESGGLYGYYFALNADFPIQPGRTYRLEILDGQGREAWAETRVPDYSTTFSTEVRVVEESFTPGGGFFGSPGDSFFEFRLRTEWSASGLDMTQYYRIEAFLNVRDEIFDAETGTFEEGVYSSGLGSTSFGVYSDANALNGRFLDNASTYLATDDYERLEELVLNFYVCDEAYYRYHLSLFTYVGGDNPFGEPSLIYSNVEGGFGAFGSFRQSTRIIPASEFPELD